MRRRRMAYRAAAGALAIVLLLGLALVLTAAGMTRAGHAAAVAVMRFLLFYAGVFALIALTAAVGAGVAATDRVVLSAGGRIIAQALHRAASFAAVGLLAVHITVEILAGRSKAADSVVPFTDHGRALYLGLGTVASDLLVLIVVTGLLRGRFARARPAWAWRALHAISYVCWPLAILHGLLAGRTAKPYVDWSYGACVAAVALGIIIRLVAAPRVRETAGSSVLGPRSWTGEPGLAALGSRDKTGVPGGPYQAGLPDGPYQPRMPDGPGQPGVPGNALRRALPGPAGWPQQAPHAGDGQ